MMYTMPKNLLSICVNFALATQPPTLLPQSESVRSLRCVDGKIRVQPTLKHTGRQKAALPASIAGRAAPVFN